jgi:hypothetical protein
MADIGLLPGTTGAVSFAVLVDRKPVHGLGVDMHRSTLAALLARPLERGLRARARAVPGLAGRAVCSGDHQVDRGLEG